MRSVFAYKRKRNENGPYIACFHGRLYIGCYLWCDDYAKHKVEWNTYGGFLPEADGVVRTEKAARAALEARFTKWLKKHNLQTLEPARPATQHLLV